MHDPSSHDAPARTHLLLWPLVLDSTAVLGSLLLSCLMPFVAIATVAALTLPRRIGLLTVGAGWAINQALGYGLLGFPSDPATIGRGLGIGASALLAFAIGRLWRSRGGALNLARAAAAFAAAFIGFEVAMFVFALLLGGTDTFTPAIIRLVGQSEALWFVALIGLRMLLARVAGEPFARGAEPAAA